jgi:hypothetical protein
MITEGVDYSFSRPSPASLAAAGKKFAVRYGGPGSDGKHLHAGELAALRGAGLDVVANAEGTAGGYTGAAAGRSWAQSAESAFRALGMPANRPIYFSVDFDAGSKDWPGIDAALRASAQVIGVERVGVYGSYDVIEHCAVTGLARWYWQTYAWSGDRVHPVNDLYQYKNGVTIGGGDCDLTRALVGDYGQWGYQEDDVALTNADKPIIKEAIKDLFADVATVINDTTADDVAAARVFRNNLNATIDFSESAGPLMTAVNGLTALVVQQSGASAQEVAEKLAPLLGPLIQIPAGASKQDVEEVIRAVFGGLKNT